MPDLREQLRRLLQGRSCLVGVGNVERGDDGLGVRLAERLRGGGTRSADRGVPPAERPAAGAVGIPAPESRAWMPEAGRADVRLRASPGSLPAAPGWVILVAGTSPDRWVGRLIDQACDTVLFLDAVEFGARPGSVALFNSGEMLTRFPQVSTHKLALGLLAQLIESNGRTRVGLLGVQPASLTRGPGLSAPVRTSLARLARVITEAAGVVWRPEEADPPRASVACAAGIPEGSSARVPQPD